MKTRLAVLAAAIILPVAALAAPGDKPGCADHPLFPTRLPDYEITDCKITDFDSVRLLEDEAPHSLEGKFTYLSSSADREGRGGLAIVRNYENALTKIGGTIVDSDEPQLR